VKLNLQGFRAVAVLAAISLPLAGSVQAADKKDQGKAGSSATVDSGAFGVFVKGQRVATETFSIEQQGDASSIKSQLKETTGSAPATQKSILEITSTGQLIRYEWSQSAGGSVTVLPKNEFLIEKISAPTSSKPMEQPFLMPNTSVILDNNFFVHREVLVWRYLATACKPDGSGGFKCSREPGDFGVLVPQDHSSLHVRMELVGKEKIQVHGTDRDMMRLNLKTDDFEWALWVDEQDHFKLMKVAIPADNTEVVRD
jgi:hypothetical protein